jgi:hypothetical protein
VFTLQKAKSRNPTENVQKYVQFSSFELERVKYSKAICIKKPFEDEKKKEKVNGRGVSEVFKKNKKVVCYHPR